MNPLLYANKKSYSLNFVHSNLYFIDTPWYFRWFTTHFQGQFMKTAREFLLYLTRFWPLFVVILAGAFLFGGVNFMVALSRLSMFGLVILVIHLVIKALFPYIRLERFSNKAAEDPLSSAIVFAVMIIFVISLCYITVVHAEPAEKQLNTSTILQKAQPFLPEFKDVVHQYWPDAPYSFYMPALVEQESCANFEKCWNPAVELKTKREYGFGLGQITIAYKKQGGVRFNKFEEAKEQYEALSTWRWDDRYNAKYQLIFITLTTKKLYLAQAPFFKDDINRWAAAMVAYNAGSKTITEHIAACKATPNCQADSWFNGLDTIELPYEKKLLYGVSLQERRNTYPKNIIYLRSNKYLIPWVDNQQDPPFWSI